MTMEENKINQPEENQNTENQNVNTPPPPQQQSTQQNVPPKSSNTPQVLGIIGLVFGIIALVISFIPCLGLYAIFPGVLAIILSVVGLVLANKSEGSKGLIIAALVISIIATLVSGYQYYVLSRTASNLQDAANALEEFNDQMEKAMDEDSMYDDEEGVNEDEYNDEAEDTDEDDVTPENSTQLQQEIDALVKEKDYDKLIDYFDKYATEYVETMIQAQNGDFEAAAKGMAQAAKLSIITAKIAIISPYLNEEQQQRLDEINKKLDEISKNKE